MAKLHDGVVAYRASGTVRLLALFMALLAESVGQAGRTAEALEWLDKARTIVIESGERVFEAELHRLRAELLAPHDASQAEAQRLFQEALAVARGQESKSIELRAAMGLARLWQQQGKRREAYDLLAPIYHGFTEGLATPPLQACKALLGQLNRH